MKNAGSTIEAHTWNESKMPLSISNWIESASINGFEANNCIPDGVFIDKLYALGWTRLTLKHRTPICQPAKSMPAHVRKVKFMSISPKTFRRCYMNLERRTVGPRSKLIFPVQDNEGCSFGDYQKLLITVRSISGDSFHFFVVRWAWQTTTFHIMYGGKVARWQSGSW
jgi:hypothetical protein